MLLSSSAESSDEGFPEPFPEASLEEPPSLDDEPSSDPSPLSPSLSAPAEDFSFSLSSPSDLHFPEESLPSPSPSCSPSAVPFSLPLFPVEEDLSPSSPSELPSSEPPEPSSLSSPSSSDFPLPEPLETFLSFSFASSERFSGSSTSYSSPPSPEPFPASASPLSSILLASSAEIFLRVALRALDARDSLFEPELLFPEPERSRLRFLLFA